MKISIIQSELSWENKKENFSQFEKLILNYPLSTDLFILPEMFSTGFSMNAKELADSENEIASNWLQQLAIEKKCAITGSVIVSEGGKYYNRLIWADPEQLLVYDKRHLFSYAKEDETFTSGTQKLLITYRNWKILPLICYDLRFPVWSRRTEECNYDLLLYVANWPEKRILAWKTLLPARAIENQSYVAGVNRIGNDGKNIYHSGDSAVYNFRGELISTANSHLPALETIELNLQEQNDFRKQFAFFNDRDQFEIK